MMQKVLATGVLGLILVGCAAESGWKVAYEQERANRQEQDARIRNLEARQQQTPIVQQPPAQRKVTMAEVVAKCEKLQTDRTIPIGCFTGATQKNLPYMSFKFANHDALKLYWEKLAEYFVVDFCGRYNEAGQGAVLSTILDDPHVIRVMNCADGNVSNWENIDDKTSVNRY
jgi:hypothetical protein